MAERYPQVRAGQKVTGSLLESMLPQTVRKVSDTSRTSTTVTADPELQLTVAANAVYVVKGILFVGGTVAGDDINIDWSAPAGSDGTWGAVGPQLGSVVVAGDIVRTLGTAITSARAYGAGGGVAATSLTITIDSLLIVGSTAGTYSLDWAAGSGAAGTVTLFQDSFLKLTRIA